IPSAWPILLTKESSPLSVSGKLANGLAARSSYLRVPEEIAKIFNGRQMALPYLALRASESANGLIHGATGMPTHRAVALTAREVGRRDCRVAGRGRRSVISIILQCLHEHFTQRIEPGSITFKALPTARIVVKNHGVEGSDDACSDIWRRRRCGATGISAMGARVIMAKDTGVAVNLISQITHVFPQRPRHSCYFIRLVRVVSIVIIIIIAAADQPEFHPGRFCGSFGVAKFLKQTIGLEMGRGLGWKRLAAFFTQQRRIAYPDPNVQLRAEAGKTGAITLILYPRNGFFMVAPPVSDLSISLVLIVVKTRELGAKSTFRIAFGIKIGVITPAAGFPLHGRPETVISLDQAHDGLRFVVITGSAGQANTQTRILILVGPGSLGERCLAEWCVIANIGAIVIFDERVRIHHHFGPHQDRRPTRRRSPIHNPVAAIQHFTDDIQPGHGGPIEKIAAPMGCAG